MQRKVCYFYEYATVHDFTPEDPIRSSRFARFEVKRIQAV